MEATAQTPAGLVLARHVVLMAAVSALNPLVWHSNQAFSFWGSTFAGSLVVAGVIYAVLSLFLTKKAKSSWPKGFLLIAWFFVAVQVITPWTEINAAKTPLQSQAQQFSDHESLSPKQSFTDEEVGFPVKR